MRIAHVVSSFSPLTETFIYDYVTELEAQGHECHVFTHDVVPRPDRPFENVHHVPRPQRWDLDRMFFRAKDGLGIREGESPQWTATRRRLGRAIREVDPDVIHAHFGQMGAEISPLAEQLDTPMVVSFHGRDAFSAYRRSPYKETYGRLFEQASAITAVSRLMADHLRSLGADQEKVHVVRVGKRTGDYPPRTSLNGRVTKWVSVGRMAEKKGHLDALKAFAGVVSSDPDQELTIVGEGPLYDDIESFIARNGLSGNVDLAGSMGHAEVKALMAEADAFVLCSRTGADGDREGVPTVLMEAQLLGLPCVSTTHSGIPEVIPEENQWLLSPEGDVASIERAMRSLIATDREVRERVAAAGRRKVEEEFNLRTEVGTLSELYESIRADA